MNRERRLPGAGSISRRGPASRSARASSPLRDVSDEHIQHRVGRDAGLAYCSSQAARAGRRAVAPLTLKVAMRIAWSVPRASHSTRMAPGPLTPSWRSFSPDLTSMSNGRSSHSPSARAYPRVCMSAECHGLARRCGRHQRLVWGARLKGWPLPLGTGFPVPPRGPT